MPLIVHWFEASGGTLGADRRAFLQGPVILADEAIRIVECAARMATTVLVSDTANAPQIPNMWLGVTVEPQGNPRPQEDPFSHPGTRDWFGVWKMDCETLFRSKTATNDALDYQADMVGHFDAPCPRVPYGQSMTPWLISRPLPAALAPQEYVISMTMRYLSVRP